MSQIILIKKSSVGDNAPPELSLTHGELAVNTFDGKLWVGDLQGSPILLATGSENIGETGLQGIQGIQGRIGADGADGATGTQGEIGIQGNTGLKGEPGLQGEIGIQGIIGADGATGTQGEIGIQGNTGLKGEPGLQGEPGLHGEPGLQGEIGIQGETGPVDWVEVDLRIGDSAVSTASIAQLALDAEVSAINVTFAEQLEQLNDRYTKSETDVKIVELSPPATKAHVDSLGIDADTLTGTPLASVAYVDAKIAALIGDAPASMDTLAEIADALGDDPNYAANLDITSMTTAAAIIDLQDRYIIEHP